MKTRKEFMPKNYYPRDLEEEGGEDTEEPEEETVIPEKEPEKEIEESLTKRKDSRRYECAPLNQDLVEMAGKYARIPEAAKLLKMSPTSLTYVARTAGAYFRIRGMTYCRVDIILEYFEKVREQTNEADFR